VLVVNFETDYIGYFLVMSWNWYIQILHTS